MNKDNIICIEEPFIVSPNVRMSSPVFRSSVNDWSSGVRENGTHLEYQSTFTSLAGAQFTFLRDMKILEVDGKKTWVVLAKYHFFTSVPEKSGVIRVTSLKQACVMQSDGKVGAKGSV